MPGRGFFLLREKFYGAVCCGRVYRSDFPGKSGGGLCAGQLASPRGGTLLCRLEGDRVFLAGQAALYAKSELYIDKNV